MKRSTSSPDYDYGPYDDEYRGFDIRDDESGRGPLILLLALGVLLIFAGVVWNTYRQGVRSTQGGLPIIGAENTDFKRMPDDRGGVEVAGQDIGFYDLIDGGEPAQQTNASIANPAPLRERTPTLAGEGPDTASAPLRLTPPEPNIPDNEVREAETEASRQFAALPAERSLAPQGAPDAILPAPSSASRFSESGMFQIQLLALRSEPAARDAWSAIKSKNQTLFQGADLDIQRADLGARGIYYRLRLGSFSSRDNAREFCTDVKKVGTDCIVVTKGGA